MKALFVSILFISAFNLGRSQSFGDDLDSLVKYSYVVVRGENNDGYFSGTGFYIRNGSKIFFITNYHVATGYDARSSIVIRTQDSIKISFSHADIPNVFSLKPIRNKNEEFYIQDLIKPDLWVAGLDTQAVAKLSKGIKIFDVNDFIDEKYFDSIPRNVIIYGYPGNKISNEKVKGELVMAYYIDNPDTLKNILTPGHNPKEVIDKFRNLYFLTSNSSLRPGMSGSPVYGEFLINGQLRLKFICVACGINSNLKTGEIIKASQVIKAVMYH